MTPELEKVVKKMCEMVGADFSKMDFTKDHWFIDYSWTLEQEKEFVEWLTDQLMKNKDLLKRFTGLFIHYKKTKQSCRKLALSFVLQYGWKYEETTEMD